MSLANVGPLIDLFLACTDDAKTEAERVAAGEALRTRFELRTEVDALGYMARASPMPPQAVSLILSAIYVCGWKWPDDPGPIEELREFIADRSRPKALRTRAFTLLLLLDLEQADAEAAASMPEMRMLVAAERAFPTIRRRDPDAAYEEATVQMLFH